MMKKVFQKPISHFTPLVKGIDMHALTTMPDDELESVYLCSKLKEEERTYQSNPDFVVTKVADEYLAVPTGQTAQDFNGMISLNRTGYFIWEQFSHSATLGEVLETARTRFSDEHNTLDLELRKYVRQFAGMGLLKEIINN